MRRLASHALGWLERLQHRVMCRLTRRTPFRHHRQHPRKHHQEQWHKQFLRTSRLRSDAAQQQRPLWSQWCRRAIFLAPPTAFVWYQWAQQQNITMHSECNVFDANNFSLDGGVTGGAAGGESVVGTGGGGGHATARMYPPGGSGLGYFTFTSGITVGLGVLSMLGLDNVHHLNGGDAGTGGGGGGGGGGGVQSTPRKLFENIQLNFQHHRRSSSSSSSSTTSSSASSSSGVNGTSGSAGAGGTTAAASTNKTTTTATSSVFDGLVVGDRVVLKEGDITKNQWKALSEFLCARPHIRSLRLQGVEITAKEADDLIGGTGLKAIRNITFCDNSIGIHDGCLERLVALLLCCGMLESTSIIRNSIRDHDVPHILSLVTHHRTLTKISLSWNGIGEKGAIDIARAMERINHSLEELDLSYNRISEHGREWLERVNERRLELLGHHAKRIHIRHQHNDSSFVHSRFQTPWNHCKDVARNMYISATAAAVASSSSSYHSNHVDIVRQLRY